MEKKKESGQCRILKKNLIKSKSVVKEEEQEEEKMK